MQLPSWDVPYLNKYLLSTYSQAGIKIARRNSNNLRYTDDTTLKAESEEELKSFLMRVKEESEKADLKINIKKNNNKKLRSCVWSHHFMANR